MTDKERMRIFKAETIGRLIALGAVFAWIGVFSDKNNDTTKASVPSDGQEKVSVKQVYADSVRDVNAVKFDTLKSRSK